ncbi:MAG: hypothetical protein ACI89L_000543 [Phycisphaerales bacterium]
MNLNVLMRAASHHVTWRLGTRMPGTFPLVFVVGYPKSGTTWITSLVADYLQLPFPKLSLLPIGCAAVVHGHETVWPRYPRCVYTIRDGRDVMTSLYFHMLRFIPENGPVPRVYRPYYPDLKDRDDTAANLARFVEAQMGRPHASRLNWADHVMSFYEPARGKPHTNAVAMKYEDLLADGERTLGEAMSRLTGEAADERRVAATVEKFSFANQAGRDPSKEDRNKFLRKGQAGDWVNHFTRETAEIFERHCGAALIRAGYETDNAWAQTV